MIYPARAFYLPGEPVAIRVPGAFHAAIWHLADCVAAFDGSDLLEWTPPPAAGRGYRVRVETESGEQWTAFDVLNRWTESPRYGFLFDFSPERPTHELEFMLAHHVNGIQFYDWLYRHDTLLSPAETYADPLGRRLSLGVVRSLIERAHECGMAAMPYTAIYAASPEFAASHSDWGLYDENRQLYDFADGFLKIMNPASGWRAHFVDECRALLAALPFDGIHADQYGEPQTGFDSGGQPVDLARAIADTLTACHTVMPDGAALVFNMVHNWPVEAICPTPVDFLYSEIWPPQTSLGDLAELVASNWKASGGRAPVFAVYVTPEHQQTVRLVQAVIMASGGYHIAHGEHGLYLSDPYFPRSAAPSAELAQHLKRLADFGVAYGEFLAFAEPGQARVATDESVWVIARQTPEHFVLNLINASPGDRWTQDLTPQAERHDVPMRVYGQGSIESVWQVTPDRDAPPQPLAFSQGEDCVEFTVPQIGTWTLVWLRRAASQDG